MLSIERLRTEIASLPLVARIGLVVLLLGGAADVLAHLEAAEHVGHLHEHTSAEVSAHVMAFVGMVIVLVGVVVDGIRQIHARRSSARHSSKGVA